jgi:hypothetical protein
MIIQIQKCNINWRGTVLRAHHQWNYAADYVQSQKNRHNKTTVPKTSPPPLQNLSVTKCAQMMQKKNCAYKYSMQKNGNVKLFERPPNKNQYMNMTEYL